MVRQLMIVVIIAVVAAAAFLWLPSAPAPAPKSEADAPTAAAAAADPAAGLDACPDRLPAGVTELSCRCTSEAMAIGTVWGAGPYTDDSAICRAALHAGAAGVEGGPVRVVEAPGRDDYPGDISRSVASQSYGEWPRSVEFRPVGEAGR